MVRILLVLGFLTLSIKAQEINIGIEPFPLLVTEDKQGLLISLLNEVTFPEASKLNFQLADFTSATLKLDNTQLDLIGFVAKGNENKNFYDNAEEIRWSIIAKIDFYSIFPIQYNLDEVRDGTIGTLKNNTHFLAEKLEIPPSKFREFDSINELTTKFVNRNLVGAIFERVSMMQAINNILPANYSKKIYYQSVASIPITLAVAKSKKGYEIKNAIDEHIEHIDSFEKLKPYMKYLLLDDKGIIALSGEK